ncbi:MAG: FliG C-terminal domain-containing protein [Ethanoligenens sp.]
MWKNTMVTTGEPLLLRADILPPGNGAEATQRTAWFRREQEVRAEVQNTYLYAKAQGMRTGEAAGREQGEREAVRQLQKARARNQALLRGEQERQTEALCQADVQNQKDAQIFADSLVEIIFGSVLDREALTADLQDHAPAVAKDAACAERQENIDNLPALDQAKLRQVTQMVFSDECPGEENELLFQNLPRLPARLLQRVCKNIKMRDMAVALKGASAAECAALLEVLPKRLHETVQQEMEFLGPVPMEDTEQAQKRILKIAHRLQKAEEMGG